MFRHCLIGVCWFLMAAVAQAWSDASHKIIASIAFQRLTPEEQRAVCDRLTLHPRFTAEFTNRMPAEIQQGSVAERQEWIFQQAAIWPDLARGYEGELADRFHRPLWHYINQPLYLDEAQRSRLEPQLRHNVSVTPPGRPDDPRMNIVQAIRRARLDLLDPSLPAEDQAVRLAWVFHTVGDVHQPLHSTAVFSVTLFPEGDKGGNLIRTKQRGNLHALWDQLLGGRAEFRPSRHRALDLISQAGLQELGTRAAEDLNEVHWQNESVQLARDAAYTAEILAPLRVWEDQGDPQEMVPLILSEDYLKTAGAAARERVVMAGYRLAAVLQQVVHQQ